MAAYGYTRQDAGGPGTPNSDAPGNDAWQRTLQMLANVQDAERRRN